MAWRRTCRCFWTVVAFVIVVAVIGLVFIYSGIYNVAASHQESAFGEWLFGTTADYSIKRHAKNIAAPALDDLAMIERGLANYRMCAGCHGAPGVERGDRAQAMNPEPPPLVDEVEEWKPNELFWITKNGIKMTGMMSWQGALPDEKIWDTVAFLKTLPSVSAEDYKARVDKLPPMPRR